MNDTIGEIRLTAANYAPKNWQVCNGQTLSIAQNQALFSILGTTYGGDGVTNFKLPDLRGRVMVGTAVSPTPGTQLGQVGGTPTVSLNVTQIPSHNHTVSLPSPQPTLTLKVSSANASLTAVSAGATLARMGTQGTARGSQFTGILSYNDTAPDTQLLPTSLVSNIGEFNSGSSAPHNNAMPYLGLTYMICVSGMYPTRP